MRCLLPLAALSLALAPSAAAGQFRIVLRGAVTQVTGQVPAPFQSAATGDAFVLTLDAWDVPTILVPGTSRSYMLNDPLSTLEIGAASAPLFPGFVPGMVTIDNDLQPPNLPSPLDQITIQALVDGNGSGTGNIYGLQTSIVDGTAQALGTDDAVSLAQLGTTVSWTSNPQGDLTFYGARVRIDAVEFVLDSIGSAYCPASSLNVAGNFARVDAFGSREIADNDVTLIASGLPNASPGYFLASRESDVVPLPGLSSGTLCLGGAIGRFVGPGQVFLAPPSGEVSLALDLSSVPQPQGPVAVQSGETWHYQAWYRQMTTGPPANHFTGATAVWFF